MKTVAVLFVICCVALILIVLIQKGRGGGLSGAFGGAMAGGILGSKTGDFLTWVTVGLVGVFLTLAVVMAKFYRPGTGDYGSDEPPPQSQTTDAGQTTDLGGAMTTTSDVNSGNDTNLPGS